MKQIETKITGCYELQPVIRSDNRGAFIKTFHETNFKEIGLTTTFAEEYYSISKKNVLRGLHFQTPPKEHKKLVYCTLGEVIDVVVDLRKGSPTYKQHQVFVLNSEKANMIYIPEGLAHGFYVKSETAIMMYKVTSEYAPENDCGIRWDTANIPWKNQNPIMSKRDQEFMALDEFESPFVFKEQKQYEPH